MEWGGANECKSVISSYFESKWEMQPTAKKQAIPLYGIIN